MISFEALKALIAAASLYSGHPTPAAQLTVIEVPEQVMAGLACGGKPECPVYGLYQDYDVIFIREDLTDKAKDHVIVHEVVHWFQDHSGKYSAHEWKCLEVVEREAEAYRVQNRYIAEVQHEFFFNRPPQVTCPEEK